MKVTYNGIPGMEIEEYKLKNGKVLKIGESAIVTKEIGEYYKNRKGFTVKGGK